MLRVRRKRFLPANNPDGRPNPKPHAYGYLDLAAVEHLVADQQQPVAELIINHREERFTHKHALVTRCFERAGVINKDEELYDGYADDELYGDQLLVAERVAAAPQGCALRMGKVIERIIARKILERPASPPA